MDEKYKDGPELRKFRSRIEPGPITKFFNAINPAVALGKTAGKDFHENSLTISIILIFSLTVAIISTVMFFEMLGNTPTKDQHMIISVAAVSWFVFLNFSFLVFEATRMFNVLLFVFIVTMTGVALGDIDQNSTAGILGISIIAIAIIPLTILLYYYFVSEGDDVVMLKTLEREKRMKEEAKIMLEAALKKREDQVKERLKEDVTSEIGIRSRIASAYIDQLIDAAKKPKKKEGEKDKKEKEKDKEKKKKEEEEE